MLQIGGEFMVVTFSWQHSNITPISTNYLHLAQGLYEPLTLLYVNSIAYTVNYVHLCTENDGLRTECTVWANNEKKFKLLDSTAKSFHTFHQFSGCRLQLRTFQYYLFRFHPLPARPKTFLANCSDADITWRQLLSTDWICPRSLPTIGQYDGLSTFLVWIFVLIWLEQHKWFPMKDKRLLWQTPVGQPQ